MIQMLQNPRSRRKQCLGSAFFWADPDPDPGVFADPDPDPKRIQWIGLEILSHLLF